MQFDDYVGRADIELWSLHTFLGEWFGPDEYITLSGMSVEGDRKRNLSMVVKASDLAEMSVEEFEKGLTEIEYNGQPLNLYFVSNPTKEENTVSLFKRGGKENVDSIRGCFIDFDVKDGSFDNKDEVIKFIQSLEYQPTLVVDNGTHGGIHAYWRISDENWQDDAISASWWSYINELAPVAVDRLIDKSRLSRLPSGIYWPKGGEKYDTVKVIRHGGPVYTAEQLLSISEEPFKRYTERIHRLRAERGYLDQERFHDKMKEISSMSGLKPHNLNVIHEITSTYINQNVTWSEILVPHGWTFVKETGEGESVWARPGRGLGDRSAVTDYHKDNGEVAAMSLLSDSPETGLADLKEAGVPLSKMQVLLRLSYNDDITKMAGDFYDKVIRHD